MDLSEDVQRTLGRIEGKLDALVTAREEDKEERGKLGDRIGILEKNQWRISGAGALALFIITAILKLA